MAYEVTATRKRPQDFDHLVGQEFVVSTLKNAIKSERIAHAYLFAGPRGVGKTSAARILAKALNCPPELKGDERFAWAGAEDIAKGRSIDVIEIDGASNTSVNDVRAIKDEVLFPPQNSRYKIYIIDEVHMLSNSAFNALLKTIEEPPPYIIFIFATTELHKVPATIRSRCQQFIFKLIPLDEIRDRLAEAAGELGVRADDEALYWIAKESTGSMRDAYTLFDQVVAFSEGHIRLELIREKLGLVGLEQINELAALCHQCAAGRAIELFHRILASGVSVEQFVIDLAEYYRGILFIKSGIERESLLGYARERFLPEAQRDYSAPQLEKIIGILLQTYRDIRYSVDPRYDMEVSISRICRIRSYVEPDELYQSLRRFEDILRQGGAAMDVLASQPAGFVEAPRGEGGPAAKAAPREAAVETKAAPAPAAAPKAFHGELDQERKNAIVGQLRKSKLALIPLLDQVLSWDVAGGRLVLTLDKRYAADTLKAESDALLDACRMLLPGVSGVDFQVTEKADGAANAASAADPRVEMVREAFRGQIVGGERP